MRVVLDGTPLLGPRTGVGRYTQHLVAELARDGRFDVAVTAFTWRGLDALAGALPAGAAAAARRIPARLLQEAWARGEFPPVELLAGRADVVHGTNFVQPPARRARGVLMIHDLTYLRLPETVTAASARYRELVPRGLRRAEAVVTPSQAVADEVVDEYSLDPARVTATPLGVDEAWFSATAPDATWLAARGLPRRYLLFVGSQEPRKNVATLLEALRRLRSSRPEGTVPPLVLVGPPGWGPALDTAGLADAAVAGADGGAGFGARAGVAAGAGFGAGESAAGAANPGGPTAKPAATTPAAAVAQPAVVTAGFLPDADLRRVVAGAVALCFPSVYEGFGLPVLEALAAGTPVVAGDVPAVREVAGGFVRLVSPRDADGWADAIGDVVDAPVAEAQAESGRKHARAFAWSRTASLTAAVYTRLG